MTCKAVHVGEIVETVHFEMEDDRRDVMIVPRCTVCYLPVGADHYATREEIDRLVEEGKYVQGAIV